MHAVSGPSISVDGLVSVAYYTPSAPPPGSCGPTTAYTATTRGPVPAPLSPNQCAHAAFAVNGGMSHPSNHDPLCCTTSCAARSAASQWATTSSPNGST